MKLCHENNGAAIYVGRATTVYNPSFFSFFLFTILRLSVHTTVEYLKTNVSTGQLLQQI